MQIHPHRRLVRLVALLGALALNGCAVQPYAGFGIAGPGWGYGPVRVGTGINVGIALPPIR
jgi:hypothetical protein